MHLYISYLIKYEWQTSILTFLYVENKPNNLFNLYKFSPYQIKNKNKKKLIFILII